MNIIIDGYNVLKQVCKTTTISDAQRSGFIAMLGKYATRKNHRIALVFDGGDTVWPSQERDHGIIVIYSGIKHSADDVIKKLMQQRPSGNLVVTSDNEIKRAVQQAGAAAIASLEFYQLVRDELQPTPPQKSQGIVIKTTSEHDPLVDALMAQASGTVYKEDDSDTKRSNSHGQKVSKKERAYLQKIKKL